MRFGLRSTRSSIAAVAACLAVLGCASGCGTASNNNDVSGAVEKFISALQSQDGQRACDLLTDRARESASGATDQSCAQAILSVQEQPSPVSGVQVWGDS